MKVYKQSCDLQNLYPDVQQLRTNFNRVSAALLAVLKRCHFANSLAYSGKSIMLLVLTGIHFCLLVAFYSYLCGTVIAGDGVTHPDCCPGVERKRMVRSFIFSLWRSNIACSQFSSPCTIQYIAAKCSIYQCACP